MEGLQFAGGGWRVEVAEGVHGVRGRFMVSGVEPQAALISWCLRVSGSGADVLGFRVNGFMFEGSGPRVNNLGCRVEG